MAQAHPADVTVPAAGVDLITVYAAMASVSSYVQNKGPGTMLVAFTSSGTIPTGGFIKLAPGEMTYGTAAHVWANGLNGDCTAAIGLTD